jgi:hypothetical protein
MTGRRGGRSGRGQFRDDSRSVSVTVNYALNLVVATMLIGGVLTATGGMVQDRRESAVRTELSVVGERLATDLMAADRLSEVGTAGPATDPTVSLSVTLPGRVGGTRYDVQVNATDSNSRLVLQSDDPEVTVVVGFHNDTAVENATVRGGDLRIALNTDSTPDRLEVRSG